MIEVKLEKWRKELFFKSSSVLYSHSIIRRNTNILNVLLGLIFKTSYLKQQNLINFEHLNVKHLNDTITQTGDFTFF